MSTDDALLSVVREVLGRSDFDPNARLSDMPGWDSLSWVRIINGVQERFACDIELAELADVERLDDLAAVIRKKTNG